MALYDLEVTEPPGSKKALKLISSISGFSERDIEQQLPLAPVTIKSSISLSEAIEIDRQLKRLGVKTRLLRVEEQHEFDFDDDADENDYSTAEELEPEAPEQIPNGDIVEIPDEEIKILLPEELAAKTSDYTQKKSGFLSSGFGRLVILLVIIAAFFGTWYVLFQKHQQEDLVEIQLSISQWMETAQRQDYLLDKGLPPERIFYKLDELDAKVNNLLTKLRPAYKANGIRNDFYRQQADQYNAIRDLAFRKALVDNGFPIHPICILENGQVRGSADLPESTLLRIQLLGQTSIESVYYAARVSSGVFNLIIDPGLIGYIYDAKATVAPFSQQSRELQRWAERKFQLTEFCNDYLPKAPRNSRYPDLMASGKAEGINSNAASEPEMKKSSQPMADPGTDILRSDELKTNFTEWTKTILDAQNKDYMSDPAVLDKIYQRLLALEVRIDQLIGLLESPIDKNRWSEKREETFGAYINLRQNITDAYMANHRITDPLKLEDIFRSRFHQAGFPNAEVLVTESSENLKAFVLEVDIYAGEAKEVYVALARIISQELQQTAIEIDHIKLRHAGKTLRWETDQVLAAADELNKTDGNSRCFSKMEFTATFQNTQ